MAGRPLPQASGRGASAAVHACGRTLAGTADLAEGEACAAGDRAAARVASDGAAFARRFPPPAATTSPLRALLHRLRAAALGGRDYPGVGVNLLAAAEGLPPWRGALTRIAWGYFTGEGVGHGLWEGRLSGGLEGHWGRLARNIDSARAFERALDGLLPLLSRRLSAHGVAPGRDEPKGGERGARGGGEPPAPDGTEEMGANGDATGSFEARAGGYPTEAPPGPVSDYRVFSRRFDQQVEVRRLLPAESLTALRRRLDEGLAELPPVARRLAARLRRALQARARRQWSFDREEGSIDASRLAPFIAGDLGGDRGGRIFKEELRAPFEGAAVTLLVDNSGSMKGRSILLATLCAELVTRALEQCGVAVEILGFTTRYRDGGPPREQWAREGGTAGSGLTPGRLNAVRHVVYKAATTPWRRARLEIAGMLHEPLLKENVDGEALLWAHARLLRRPEEHRVLVVISDGAPLDQATAEANGRDYLERHLFEVVEWIERDSPVQLLAIGIGHDVNRYYRRAITIAGPDALAEALLDQVAEALLPG